MESHHDLISLFEHDLRANAFRVCREGKPVSTFPDHALRAAKRYLVRSLDSEQVVTMKAVRVHCHSVPRIGSDTS
jgi:hypothetical protein